MTSVAPIAASSDRRTTSGRSGTLPRLAPITTTSGWMLSSTGGRYQRRRAMGLIRAAADPERA